MVILKDLLEIMSEVDRLYIMARGDDGILLREYYIQPESWKVPPGIRDRYHADQLTLAFEDLRIPCGVETKAVAPELLEAVVTRMSKIGTELIVDVVIDPMQVETVGCFYEHLEKTPKTGGENGEG